MPKAKRKSARKKSTSFAKKTISPQVTQGLIQKKAYELYEKRGHSHGNDWDDWLEAERLLKSRKY